MKVATFNVENLFRRANALAMPTRQESRAILDDYALFNDLISRPKYTDATKTKLVKLLVDYNLVDRKPKKSDPFILQETRERLFKVPKGKTTPVIEVSGRADWDGWLELQRGAIGGEAIRNTARVIQEVAPDILAVVEVEDRTAMQLFNDQALKGLNAGFAFHMLIDGNDPRGIDVGLYSQRPIGAIRTNVYAGPPGQPIFSRDCAEYEILLDSGKSLWMLINHFKSQGYGNKADNDKRRKAQAGEVARIYQQRHGGDEYVIVAGDLNDDPDSGTLDPLLKDTDLRDAMAHPVYTGKPGALKGTYDTGTPANKLDYLLLSPALWAKIRDVDVERRGIYAPRTFPPFDTVTSDANAASDHGALWVDLDIN